MEGLYISKLLAESLLQLAETSGLNNRAKFGKTLRHSLSDEANTLIPYEHYARFYDYCIQTSNDPLFGLHQGEKYNMAALGVVGQIIQVSATIQEGVEKCCAHFNLISNVLQLDLQFTADSFVLVFKVDSNAKKIFPLATKHLVLSSMVFANNELNFLTLKKVNPILVEIDFEAIEKESFNRVFNTSVVLESTENKMEFHLATLAHKIVFSDYELLQVLESVACARLQSQKTKKATLSTTIATLIYALLNPAIPSFDSVAENLNMSPRNLQRKLQQEGTSYSKIVEEVKKKLVVDYLKKDLSVKEISYLMGYSEPSAFVSAFKKWFGDTPGHFKLLL